MSIIFRIISKVNRGVGFLSMIVLGVLGILIVADVISRELANESLPGVTEIVFMGIVAIIFLTFAYTEETGRHIKIDIFSNRLPIKGQSILTILVYIMGIFSMGLLAYLAGLEAIYSLRHGEYLPALIRIPVYPTKFAVFIGFVLLTLQYAVQLATKLIGEKPEIHTEDGMEPDVRNL